MGDHFDVVNVCMRKTSFLSTSLTCTLRVYYYRKWFFRKFPDNWDVFWFIVSFLIITFAKLFSKFLFQLHLQTLPNSNLTQDDLEKDANCSSFTLDYRNEEEEKLCCLSDQSSSSLLFGNKLYFHQPLSKKYAIPTDCYGIVAHLLHCINESPLTYTGEGLPVAMI